MSVNRLTLHLPPMPAADAEQLGRQVAAALGDALARVPAGRIGALRVTVESAGRQDGRTLAARVAGAIAGAAGGRQPR